MRLRSFPSYGTSGRSLPVCNEITLFAGKATEVFVVGLDGSDDDNDEFYNKVTCLSCYPVGNGTRPTKPVRASAIQILVLFLPFVMLCWHTPRSHEHGKPERSCRCGISYGVDPTRQLLLLS